MRALSIAVLLCVFTVPAFAGVLDAVFGHAEMSSEQITQDLFDYKGKVVGEYEVTIGRDEYELDVSRLYNTTQYYGAFTVGKVDYDGDSAVAQVEVKTVTVLVGGFNRPLPLMARDVVWNVLYQWDVDQWAVSGVTYASSVPAADPPPYNADLAKYYFNAYAMLCDNEDYRLNKVVSVEQDGMTLNARIVCHDTMSGRRDNVRDVVLRWTKGFWSPSMSMVVF